MGNVKVMQFLQTYKELPAYDLDVSEIGKHFPVHPISMQ